MAGRAARQERAAGLPPVEEVEIGRYYGDAADRSLRVVFNERNIHPFQPYMPEAMANQLDYFETVFDMDFELAHDDQVWYWKELLGALSMIAAFIALVPLSRILLDTRYFRPVIHELPPALPRPRNRSGPRSSRRCGSPRRCTR